MESYTWLASKQSWNAFKMLEEQNKLLFIFFLSFSGAPETGSSSKAYKQQFFY